MSALGVRNRASRKCRRRDCTVGSVSLGVARRRSCQLARAWASAAADRSAGSGRWCVCGRISEDDVKALVERLPEMCSRLATSGRSLHACVIPLMIYSPPSLLPSLHPAHPVPALHSFSSSFRLPSQPPYARLAVQLVSLPPLLSGRIEFQSK